MLLALLLLVCIGLSWSALAFMIVVGMLASYGVLAGTISYGASLTVCFVVALFGISPLTLFTRGK